MKTIADLIEFAREQVKPFADGRLADDWEERSMKVSAVSDYLLLRNRDDAFVRDGVSDLDLEMYSSTGYRQKAAKDLLAVTSGSEGELKKIPLEIVLSDRDRDILVELCMPQDLDYDDVHKELARLRKENRILREERAILKKATAFFAS